jgi:hypothetical protein
MKRVLVDVYRVAAAFGCTDRQVQLLALEGMPKAGHGRYDLQACTEWFEGREKRKVQSRGSIATQTAAATARRRVLDVVRRELLALPFNVAPRLVGKACPEIKQILRKQICQVLLKLSAREEMEYGSKRA